MRKELSPLYKELRKNQRRELESALDSVMAAQNKGYITERMAARIYSGKAAPMDYVRRIAKKIPSTKALVTVGEAEKASRPIERVIIEIHYGARPGAYGYQCMAAVEVRGAGHVTRYESDYTRGCGYDKPSTAAAEALDWSPEIMYLLYKRKAEILENPGIHYPYGANYNLSLPSFDGGVGMSAITGVFKDLGFTPDYYSTLGRDEIYIFRRGDHK